MVVYRIYDYLPEDLNRIEKEILELVFKHQLKHISIKKSYYKGFHLAIKDLSRMDIISNYLNRVKIKHLKEIDYNYISSQIQFISKLEESELLNLPLYKHGEVIKSDNNILYPGKRIFSKEYTTKIEELETSFLSKIFPLWLTYSEDCQNILLRNIWIYFASKHRYGVEAGYLAFKSNFEYFKEELKDIDSKQKQRILMYLASSCEENDEDTMEKILNSNNYIYQQGKEFVLQIEEIVKDALKRGKVKIDNMYFPDDFFERHQHWSKFHDSFYHEHNFLKQYHSTSFLTYRLVIGVLYSILPELHVSNLRKEKVSGLVVNKIEGETGVTWEKVFKDAKKGK